MNFEWTENMLALPLYETETMKKEERLSRKSEGLISRQSNR